MSQVINCHPDWNEKKIKNTINRVPYDIDRLRKQYNLVGKKIKVKKLKSNLIEISSGSELKCTFLIGKGTSNNNYVQIDLEVINEDSKMIMEPIIQSLRDSFERSFLDILTQRTIKCHADWDESNLIPHVKDMLIDIFINVEKVKGYKWIGKNGVIEDLGYNKYQFSSGEEIKGTFKFEKDPTEGIYVVQFDTKGSSNRAISILVEMINGIKSNLEKEPE